MSFPPNPLPSQHQSCSSPASYQTFYESRDVSRSCSPGAALIHNIGNYTAGPPPARQSDSHLAVWRQQTYQINKGWVRSDRIWPVGSRHNNRYPSSLQMLLGGGRPGRVFYKQVFSKRFRSHRTFPYKMNAMRQLRFSQTAIVASSEQQLSPRSQTTS